MKTCPGRHLYTISVKFQIKFIQFWRWRIGWWRRWSRADGRVGTNQERTCWWSKEKGSNSFDPIFLSDDADSARRRNDWKGGCSKRWNYSGKSIIGGQQGSHCQAQVGEFLLIVFLPNVLTDGTTMLCSRTLAKRSLLKRSGLLTILFAMTSTRSSFRNMCSKLGVMSRKSHGQVQTEPFDMNMEALSFEKEGLIASEPWGDVRRNFLLNVVRLCWRYR